MNLQATSLADLRDNWKSLGLSVAVPAIRSNAEYLRTVEVTRDLIALVGDEHWGELANLLWVLGEAVSQWELRQTADPRASNPLLPLEIRARMFLQTHPASRLH